jgi:hypothetical protein
MSSDSDFTALKLSPRWWEEPQIPAPRPWRIAGVSANPGEAEIIVDANGNTVAWTANTLLEPDQNPSGGDSSTPDLEVLTPENRANARHLVRAINHHAALCALNEQVIRTIGTFKKDERKALGLNALYASAMAVFDAVSAEPAAPPAPERRWTTLPMS